MKVIESKRRDIKEFCEIADGTVFRFKNNVFIKTKKFFSAEDIEDYFDNTDIMEDVADMHKSYLAYNALCLSREDCYRFSAISGNTKVEVLEVELHIV